MSFKNAEYLVLSKKIERMLCWQELNWIYKKEYPGSCTTAKDGRRKSEVYIDNIIG